MKSFKDLVFPNGYSWKDFFTEDGGFKMCRPGTDEDSEGYKVAYDYYEENRKAGMARYKAKKQEKEHNRVAEALSKGVKIVAMPYTPIETTGWEIRGYSEELDLTLVGPTYTHKETNWEKAVLVRGKAALTRSVQSWGGYYNNVAMRTSGSIVPA